MLLVVAQRRGEQGGHHPRLRGDEETGDRRGAVVRRRAKPGPSAPRGPHFMSPAVARAYKHALREANRLGIVLSVNLCSGWNAGGPWVTPEHAAKKIVGAATMVKGPGRIRVSLPQPEQVARVLSRHRRAGVPGAARADRPQPKLTASSSYREYPPALAQDGSRRYPLDLQRRQAGHGPDAARSPSISSSITTRPGRPPGCTCNPYPDCGPKEIEIQCSDDGKTYRTLRRAIVAPQPRD